MEQLKAWLAEKQGRGVSQVRITTVLDKLGESMDEYVPAAEAIERGLDALSRRQQFALMRKLLYDLRPEWVGTKEAAELLGVERPRIGRYLRQHVMPPPVGVVSKSIPFWLRADVEPLRALVEGRRRSDHPDAEKK